MLTMVRKWWAISLVVGFTVVGLAWIVVLAHPAPQPVVPAGQVDQPAAVPAPIGPTGTVVVTTSVGPAVAAAVPAPAPAKPAPATVAKRPAAAVAGVPAAAEEPPVVVTTTAPGVIPPAERVPWCRSPDGLWFSGEGEHCSEASPYFVEYR